MRLSIVITAHNGEKYLRQAIESALNQSRRADEIVLFDNASTDATDEIARSYGDKIKYHFNDMETGFVDAWNRAIHKATGDFVTILHQDDLLHPDYLTYIEAAILTFPQVRHFYTGYNYIDEHGATAGHSPQPHLTEPVLYTGKEYTHNYLQGVITKRHIHRCPGVTTSRALLLSECTYRKEAGHIADDDFFLRVGEFTDVVGISYPLASFRHHPESTTSKVDSLTLKLAEAYLFQVRYYLNPTQLLNNDDIDKINALAVKFVNLLLYEGLIHDQRSWILKAFALHNELEELLPSFMSSHLPSWGKMLWAMASPEGGNYLAKSYAKSLYTGISVRDRCKANLKLR
ncbi:glycosyl transferase, family 2 [Smithella sp. ME-1]|uniref:Glycosyl transferase, family 2 n=1 Tax=hydrocarbon metagenome TaxID=938273 RepID=A0A0W8FPT5_9ZZZZ|nr:glycosyl transferase, family 2 [Smithella sp. ME-1]